MLSPLPDNSILDTSQKKHPSVKNLTLMKKTCRGDSIPETAFAIE